MTPEHQGPPGAEPPAVGTGYATAQLARALSRAQHATNPSVQLQAQGHVERWTAALLGQFPPVVDYDRVSKKSNIYVTVK